MLFLMLGVSQSNALVCDGAVTELSFDPADGASIGHNNFGDRQQNGADNLEARILNTGTYAGKTIDVVLKSFSPGFHDPDCSDGGNTTWKGKDGLTGNFDCAMKLDEHGMSVANFYLGKHDFHPMWINFEYADGSGPATLPYVDLTFWDTGAAEYFAIGSDAFDSYACGNYGCTLSKMEHTITGNSSTTGVTNYTALKFVATEKNLDDVVDIWNPTEMAERNAVKFRIKNSSKVLVEFGRLKGGGGTIQMSGASAVNEDLQCPSSPIAVHGDPMFKINGTGAHFWVTPDILTPMLAWTSPSDKHMELSGSTFQTPDAANQWLRQVVITENGDTVYNATVDTDIPPVEMVGGLQLKVVQTTANKFDSVALQKKHEHLNVHFENGLLPGSKGIFAEMAGLQKMSEATEALLFRVRPDAARHALQP